MSSSSEEDDSGSDDDWEDAISRSSQSPPFIPEPNITQEEEPRKSDVPLIQPQTTTALPKGVFQLTKINDQGEKITILAGTDPDTGQIVPLEDGNNSTELLGDMNEVMERLSSVEQIKSETVGEEKTTTSSQSTTSTPTLPIITSNPTLKTRSHKRHRHALEHLKEIQNIQAHQQAIWVILFEPIISVGSRFFLATGGQDKIVRVWLCQRSATGASPRHQTAWSHGFGRNESTLETSRWKIIEQPYRTYVGHTSDVVDLAWSPSATIGENGGRYLLSASLDKTVRLWHTSKENLCLCVFAHPKSVTSVDFHPSKQGKLRFLTGCFDCKIRVWDVESGKVQQWTQVQNIVTATCFRPDGDLIVVGLIDGVCLFFHYGNGNKIKFYTQIECRNKRGKHRKGCKVTGLQWSTRNDSTLLVSTNDSRTRLWRTQDFSQIMKYKGSVNESMQIHSTFSPDGGMIVSGSEDGRVLLWRTDHDWYLPGKSTARMTGYSRNKNDSYESFEATSTSSTTATSFMPFMTTVRDAVVASAKRKLSSGIITQDEFAMIIMSQAQHDLQMSEADGGKVEGRHRTDETTTSVSIVTADADGKLKLFVSGIIVDEEEQEEEEQEKEEVLAVLVPPFVPMAVAVPIGNEQDDEKATQNKPDTPPPLPPPRRPSRCENTTTSTRSDNIPPALPTRRSMVSVASSSTPPPIPSRRSTMMTTAKEPKNRNEGETKSGLKSDVVAKSVKLNEK